MDYRSIFEVSAAGMGLEKKRLEVATLNLANMNSTAPAGTEAYKPLRVVAHAVKASFSDLMSLEQANLAPMLEVVPTNAAPRLVKDAGHPHADAKGFVSYPGVDQATEMVTAMTALRAYEGNVAAAGFARAMAVRALDIGGTR